MHGVCGRAERLICGHMRGQMLKPFDQAEYFQKPPKNLEEALLYFCRTAPGTFEKHGDLTETVERLNELCFARKGCSE